MNNVTTLTETYLKPVSSQPHEATHPAQVNFANFDNNPALKQASDTLGYAWDKLGSVRQLRARQGDSFNPEHTPARHDRAIREAVAQFDHEWAPRMDNARGTIKTELSRVEGELERAANLKANPNWYSAIVGTLQGLDPGARQNVINDLIEQADGPTLATLIEAPLFVTGLTVEQRDSLRPRLYEKVNPKGASLRTQLTKALAKLEAASIAVINDRNTLLEGTDRFVRKPEPQEPNAGFARIA